MSGGSMNYIYHTIDEIAHIERDPVIRLLLKDLADYLHEEEWFTSGDTSKQDYEDARKLFKDKWLSDKAPDMKPLLKLITEDIAEVLGVSHEE